MTQHLPISTLPPHSTTPDKDLSTWTLGPVRMRVHLPNPQLRFEDDQQTGWTWVDRHFQRTQFVGEELVLSVIDLFECNGGRFEREMVMDEKAGRIALRGRFLNTSEKSVCLDQWHALKVRHSDGFSIGEWPAQQWRLWRQAAQKSDSPVVCQPADGGENLLYATVEGTEVDDLEDTAKTTPILSEPFLVLGREQGTHPGAFLWVGVLDQLNQLGRVVCELDERGLPELLSVEIPFDGALLMPGQMVETAWIWVQGGERWQDLGRQYWQQLIEANPPRRNLPIPSVYCTWYFYGRTDLTPGVVREELDWFRKESWPLDVFQLDSGWEKCFGDWIPGRHWEEWTLEETAAHIASAGFQPGIWTCPFLADQRSDLAAAHPEWILRDPDGEPVYFRAAREDHYVLDATHPEVMAWLGDLYRRLLAAGFTYHKLDFTRALVPASPCSYHNSELTKAQVYRTSMELIREALGDEAYLLVCGGLYLPVAGLADGQRSGSDVRGQWEQPRADARLRQNLLRTWMAPLWHADPDSAMIRRRDQPFNENPISLGKLNDEEARTIVVNQYLGGGLACFTERMPELDADRAALYRHLLPPLGAASTPVDLFARPGLPAFHTTRVLPKCPELGPWQTVAIINFGDTPATYSPCLEREFFGFEEPMANSFLVWEFFTQNFLGETKLGCALPSVEVPPHGTRVLRLQPIQGPGPFLLGTDRHLSMGGVEIRGWHHEPEQLQIEFSDSWQTPFHYWLAWPRPEGWDVEHRRAETGQVHEYKL